MEFKQLRSFVTVAEQNSFTKAARILYISQPTISTHIRQLEAELKTPLIIRTTKSVELTAKGQEVYGYAVSILDMKERMVRSCGGEKRKILQLGASTIPSAYVLPEVLPAFGQLHPDVYFVVHQGDSQSVADAIRDKVYDLGLIGMRCSVPGLECIPFCEDHMVFITPVSEPYLRLQEEQDPGSVIRTLLKAPIILREKGSGSRKSADRFLAAMNVNEDDLNVTARINDQEAIKNMVAGGLGVSIISERAARNFRQEKRILAFPLPEGSASRTLCVICRKDFRRSDYAEDFIRFLTREYDRKTSS
jgi:DNA-binding transcriptional LysR family regulator